MNRYRVYSVIHPGAVELIESASSFTARQLFAAKHRYDLLDCVARREWVRTEPVECAAHALPGCEVEG